MVSGRALGGGGSDEGLLVHLARAGDEEDRVIGDDGLGERGRRYTAVMTTETEELVRVAEQLPASKRAAVTEFALFLLSRDQMDGDDAWEQIVADRRPRPKLDEFLAASDAERSEPLDLDRLKS